MAEDDNTAPRTCELQRAGLKRPRHRSTQGAGAVCHEGGGSPTAPPAGPHLWDGHPALRERGDTDPAPWASVSALSCGLRRDR